MMDERMTKIFDETKEFEIDGPDRASATIKAFRAGEYLIIDRKTKVGHYPGGGYLEPMFEWRKDWYLDNDLSVDWIFGQTSAETLRFVILQADQWFETVSLEVGKFNSPD